MDLRKRYKRTMTAVGGALLLWAAFFNLFQVILNVLKNSLSATLNAVTLEIVLLILYGASYLCAFMLPALFIVILKLLGADNTTMLMCLFAFATPLGLNTVVFPAAYGGDPSIGVSMATISHTVCVITIPVMYTLLTVLVL